MRKNHIDPLALINFLTLCGGGFLKTSASEKVTHLKNLDELVSKVSYFHFIDPFTRIAEKVHVKSSIYVHKNSVSSVLVLSAMKKKILFLASSLVDKI